MEKRLLDTPPEIQATPCPACDHKTLRLELRVEAKPVGSFSLSGQQIKFSASEWPWLTCDSDGCSFEEAASR